METVQWVGVKRTESRDPIHYHPPSSVRRQLLGFPTTHLAEVIFGTPGDHTKPFLAVVVADTGKAAAAIMAEPKKHYDKTYKLISNCHTLDDVAVTLSEILGKKIKYERTSYEDSRSRFINVVGFSEEDADGILEIYKLTDEENPLVNDPDMSHITKITGEEPTTLKEWVTEVAPAFSAKP